MHRVNVSLLCLLSLSFAGSVFGQAAGNPQSGPSGASPDQSLLTPGVATYDSYSGGATLGSGTYFNIRHMTGPGVGYGGSYSQVGGFVPLWYNEDAFFAPDVRLMVSNSSQVGGNAGLVGRKYVSSWDRIVGAYGYFDVDQSTNNNTYSQSSFGVETLGRFWDLRANGYFPNGRQDNFVSTGAAICVSGNPYLQGNNIVFNGQQGQNREVATGGGDVEFGLPVFPSTPWLRAYAGMYFYSTSQQAPVKTDDPIPNQAHSNPVGFRGRLDAWISDDLLAGVNVTTDPVWGTNVNAVVDFRFSGFKPTRYFPQWNVRERMLAPVQRNWRVAVEQYGTAVNTAIAAVNPTTGNPYFVDFINNAAPAGGNGTFEHPFNSFNFPNGIPGADIIVVERGTSTLANPYVGTIKLYDNQRLLGEGAANIAPIPLSATYGDCSVGGNFTLPGFNGSGNYPFVTNGGGTTPIVTVRNNNEVAGFNFVNSGGDAIYGDSLSNYYLHDLQLVGNTGHGIALTHTTGTTTTISNINLPTGTDNPNPGGLGNNAAGGILVTSGVGGLGNLQLTNIFMNSNPAGTQPYGISLTASLGPLNVTETNVTTNGNGVGQQLSNGDVNSLGQLTGVAQPLVATLNNVTANGNVGDGIDVNGYGSTVTVNATNPATPLTTNGNGGSGLVFSMNTGTGALNLNGSQANNNGVDGVGLFGSNGSVTTVSIINGQMNGNTRDGLHQENASGSNLNIVVDPSSLSNNGRNGFYYQETGASLMTANFLNDTLTVNGGSAFFGTLDNSNVNIMVTGNKATNSGLNGFHLDGANGSNAVVNVSGSDFSLNKTNGFDVQLVTGSAATFTLTNTVINNSVQNGLSFLVDSSALSFTGNATTINGSGVNGILGTVQNSSAATVTFSGVGSSISGSKTGDGVFITGTTLSNVVAVFDNTAINNNAGNGIHIKLNDSPGSKLNLTGTTTVNQNGVNGVWLEAANNSYMVPTFVGTTIQGNGADGLRLDATSGSALGGSPVAGTFTDVNILDNGLNGVESNVDGQTTISNLIFNGGKISNSSGTSPQQVGYQFNVTNNGLLNTIFTGGVALSNNGQNAINGTVTGTGTGSTTSATANILLDGTDASGSGKDNVVLNVAQGGLLHFTGQKSGANLANFSNSLTGAGLKANVTDLNSLAIVDLNGAKVDGNKTVGYIGTVNNSIAPTGTQTGATLISDLEASTFNNNTLQGLRFDVSGNGAEADIGAGTTTVGTAISVNGNGAGGLLANANNLGTINFREIGSSFNNNKGGDGAYFGGNNGNIRVLFSGGTTNGNNGDGLGFGPVAPNASDFNSNYTISLQNGWTSTGNTGYGLNVNGNGADSVYLIQDPKNPIVLTGNGAGPENLNFNGVNKVLLQLLGSSSGTAGDGFHLSFNNITTAIVSIDGLGTGHIDNNAGDGIFLQFNDVTNAAVTISGYQSISGNGTADGAGGLGGDGIHIEMTGVTKTTNGAIQIQGLTPGDTTMAGNHDNGVNIQLTKTTLVNNFSSLGGVNFSVLTTTDNQPLDFSAPIAVPLTGNNGIVPANGLVIDHLNVMNSGNGPNAINGNGYGIHVNGTDSSIAPNGGFITNNTVNGSAQGAGIGVTMNNTVAPTGPVLSGLTISNNYVGAVNAGQVYSTTPTATPNNGDGIQVSIVNAFAPILIGGKNTTADGVVISNNVVNGNLGNGIDFTINNPVGSITTVNDLQIVGNIINGNQLNGVNLDLSNVQMNNPTLSNDTILSNKGDGILANLEGTTWTNLTTSGNTVDSNTLNGMELVLDKSTIATWTAVGGEYSKNMLSGLQITNSGTSSVTGAAFNGVAFNLNGADGVQMTTSDATKSTFGTLLNPITFTNGTMQDNGQLAAGSGVNMTTLANGSIANLVFVNDQIGNNLPNLTQQYGLIYNIAATGGVANATFVDGAVSNNVLNAISGTVNGTGVAGASSSTVSLTGVTVAGNQSTGLLFNVNAAGALNLLVQDDAGTASVISGNGGDGIQINGSDKLTSINATVLNSQILDNGQSTPNAFNGISMNLTNYDTHNVAKLTVTNSTIGNTAGTTQNDGIYFNLVQNGVVPPLVGTKDGLIVAITNSILTNNSASALEGTVVGPAGGANTTTGAFITLDAVTANANGGNGIALNLSNGGLASVTVKDLTTVNGNGQHGLFINATDANTLAAVLIQDSSFNSNGTLVFAGDGVNATAANGAAINIGAETTGLGPVSFSGNTGNGIDVIAVGLNAASDIDLHNAFVGLSAANGLLGNTLNGLTFQAVDGGTVHLRAYNTRFDGNGQAGLLGAVNDTNGNNTEGLVNIIGGSADGNGGDGYSLTASNTAGGTGFGVAYLTGQFQPDDLGNPISAQNNGGIGLNFVASNPTPPGGGIVGNLLLAGGSNLSNNAGGSVNINMIGADQAVIQLSGIFDGNTNGDGIKIDLEQITGLALVDLQGPGEVKNNGGDGIDVIMKNVFQGGVFIGGWSGGITGNGAANGAGGLGQDGIQITMNNVGSAVGGGGGLTVDGQFIPALPAPQIPQPTNLSGNSGNGINVNVSGGSVIDNNAFTALLNNPGNPNNKIRVVDFTHPDTPITVAHPAYPPVPNPLLSVSTLPAPTALGITFSPTVAIQNWTIDNNGNATAGNQKGDGILFTLDGATMIGAPTINNNVITDTGASSTKTGANMHDGIQVNLLNGAGFGTAAGQSQFNIVNNLIGTDATNAVLGNNGNGINFIENDTVGATAPYTTLQTLNISNNTVANNTGFPGASGSGIVLQLQDAPTLATITLDTDMVLNNKGDGVQMLNPNAGFTGNIFNNNLTLNFTNDTITGNGTATVTSATTLYPPGTMGVDIVLNSSNADTTTTPGTAIPETTIINILAGTGAAQNQFNNISNNASFGLFVQAINNAAYNLNVTNANGPGQSNVFNVFNANTDAGIAIIAGSSTTDLTKFSVGNILIDDVQITRTILGNHGPANYPFGGDGIAVLTQQYAEIASFVVGDQTVRNTQLTSNDGDGLKIVAIGNSEFRQTTKDAMGRDTSVITQLGQATVQLQNIDTTLNGGNGIEIGHQDTALLSWDDSTANGALGANLFLQSSDPQYPISWSYITGGVSDTYTYTNTPTQLNSYVYSGAGNVSGTNPNGYDGSFIHMNDIVANQNTKNGLFVNTTNQQFPVTRIDIVDYLQNGNSQFGEFDPATGNNLGNGANGMLFTSTAKSITVVHAQDTVASGNVNDGILVQALNASAFGDVLTSVPAGDPTSPSAQLSTFNGMTMSGNGNALTAAAGGGNGLEVQSNGPSDVQNATSSAVVGISMTNSTSANTLNPGGRNLFDNNAGDSIKFTASRYSTNYLSLNAVDIRHSGTVNANLGGSGIHFITYDYSTSTLKDINTTIGTPTSDLGVKGLVGNGIWVATNNFSNMSMLIGDQTITNPPNPDTDANGGSADVKIFDNAGAGILVTSTNNSRFFGETYDTASLRNGNRGYSALIAQGALAIHDINFSNMSDNNREGVAVIANAETQSGDAVLVPERVWGPPIYNIYHYLNMNPLTVGGLVLTNSTINNNGNTTPYATAQTNVNGIEIDVSTYANVTADIRNNVMKGNLLNDFATGSFEASTSNLGLTLYDPASGGNVTVASMLKNDPLNNVNGFNNGLGGFLADGTINPNGKLDTPASFHQTPFDHMFLEDTAQLDMRFMNNVGNKLDPSSGASSNNNLVNQGGFINSGRVGQTNAFGAVATDPSAAKYNIGEPVSFFQVDAYHYDIVSSVTQASGATPFSFSGTNILPLDAPTVNFLQDPANFPGAITVNAFGNQSTAARNLQQGIVSTDQFYTNLNPTTAFTQTRIDDITRNVYENTVAVAGVTNYVGATGTFTLANGGIPTMQVGDMFRVHLLDTNSFSNNNIAANIELAFLPTLPLQPNQSPGFVNVGVQEANPTSPFTNGNANNPISGTTGVGTIMIPPGDFNAASLLQGVFYAPNPLAPYFDFPSISFPPY